MASSGISTIQNLQALAVQVEELSQYAPISLNLCSQLFGNGEGG